MGDGKAPTVWSAALGFAPVVRKRPLAKAAPSVPAGFSVASEVVKTQATIYVEPKLVLPEASTSLSADQPKLLQPHSGNSQSKISKPPPLTLPDDPSDDVNGFRNSEAGRKLADKENKRGKVGYVLPA